MAGGHLLQAVVTDGGRGAEGGLDVSFFEQSALLCGVRPNSSEAVGLQL